jgi:hypothetical protein
VQVAEEALDVGAVAHQQVDVLAARRRGRPAPGARSAGPRWCWRAGPGRRGRGPALRATQRGPEAAARGEGFGDRIRHAFAIEVEQGEGRLAGGEVDVLPRARDGALGGLAPASRRRVTTGTASGVGTETAEGDRLVGGMARAPPPAAGPAKRRRSARPSAMTQAAPSLATRPAASRAMRLVSGPPALVRRVSSLPTRKPAAGGGRVRWDRPRHLGPSARCK